MNISVALCTYNGSRFLEAQLRTIADQTRPPFELVVCDDGSTDSTPEIVQAFARSVPFPVHFTRNEVNLGSTKNFEKAITLCKGEAIALCDQDDLWVAEKLQTMADVLEQNPKIAGVFSDATLIDEDSITTDKTLWQSVNFGVHEQRIFHKDQSFFLVHERPVVTGATLVFRSSFLQNVLPIPSEWIHDEWIALVLASLVGIKPISKHLISYRLHATQQLGLKEIPKLVTLQRGRQDRIAFQRSNALKLSLVAAKLTTLSVSHKTVTYARRKAEYLSKRADLLKNGRSGRISGGFAILPGHFRFAFGFISYLRDFLHA